MIIKFGLDANNALTDLKQSFSSAVWIDVVKPTAKEREQLATELNLEIPVHHEIHQLEYSNRFYEEDDGIYMSLNIVTKAAPIPESHHIIFILSAKKLITVRYSNSDPIQEYFYKVKKLKSVGNAHIEIFLLILEKYFGSLADMVEIIDEKTDDLALVLTGTIDYHIKTEHHKKLSLTLRNINFMQSLLSKLNQSLYSLDALLSFFKTGQDIFKIKDQTTIERLTQDIFQLSEHVVHLTHKLDFQLQSTLGLIGMEQTNVIKIFSVLAMVFMPPTLIASIYGMNFKHMPELHSFFGYPIALLAMLCSTFLPYKFFKHKGWI